jgi:hypothetical protein
MPSGDRVRLSSSSSGPGEARVLSKTSERLAPSEENSMQPFNGCIMEKSGGAGRPTGPRLGAPNARGIGVTAC